MTTSKLQYVGWQVGLTYQTPDREGLSHEYLERLLDEMADHGMNFISFMMISHALNDAVHDGYAWPVRNERLKCYVDANCANTDPDREFLSEIIAHAGELGFHINLFMNGFWWNHEKVRRGYKDIRVVTGSEANENHHHCSDNADTWALACDGIEDLLTTYSHPAVKSYGFEMIGQSTCTCPDTMKAFQQTLKTAGDDVDDHTQPHLLTLWREMRRRQVLEELVLAIKTIRPGIDVWHHGYLELGDLGGYRFSPALYRKAKVDVAMPCIHAVTDEKRLKRVLESSADFPTALHIDTRDTPTRNYAVPLKRADDIVAMGRWIQRHRRDNLAGAVFFNEPATSDDNRHAAYEVINAWRKNGLL